MTQLEGFQLESSECVSQGASPKKKKEKSQPTHTPLILKDLHQQYRLLQLKASHFKCSSCGLVFHLVYSDGRPTGRDIAVHTGWTTDRADWQHRAWLVIFYSGVLRGGTDIILQYYIRGESFPLSTYT